MDDAPQFPVLRYVAMLRAARDFGLRSGDIEAVARRHDHRDLQGTAEALADAVLARHELDEILAA